MDLEKVKEARFGDVDCDFYKDKDGNTWMTSEQLGRALEYADPVRNISKVVGRHGYLGNPEFTTVVKLTTPSGVQNTRVFSEDGIMEVSMLARTIVAQRFRSWVRKVIKAIHHGDIIVSTPVDHDIEKYKAQTDMYKAQTEAWKAQAEMYNARAELAEKVFAPPAQFKEVVGIPKFYTATDIAEELGVSISLIGRIANTQDLKHHEYGRYVKSNEPGHKSRRFHYNERGRQRIVEAYTG